MTRWSWLLCLAVTLTLTGANPAPATAQGTEDELGTYRLVDTWSDEPWELTAGRYGHVGDISSGPDGTQYILDTRHDAIHVLDDQAQPIRVFRVASDKLDPAERSWFPHRLDVGFDGWVGVLSLAPPGRALGFGRVDFFDASGGHLAGYEISAQGAQFTDIAVGPEGVAYVTRAPLGGIFAPEGQVGVNLYDRDGQLLANIEDPDHLTYPEGIDVSRQGTAYIINRIPVPGGEPPPGPTPTPAPSMANEIARANDIASPNQADEPIEGIVVYDERREFVEQWPFVSGEDVAVGPAGVFIARHVEIFPYGERNPVFSGDTGRVYAAYFGRAALHLDVPADGRLLAGFAHCYFQGVGLFDDLSAAQPEPRLVGGLDAPELEGPPYPLRVAADEWVAVLEGRFTARGRPGPGRTYEVQQYAQELQTVQRWTGGGFLDSQLGICSGSEANWVKDVALVDDTVYTVDLDILQSRPRDGFPAWRYWPGELRYPETNSHLTGVAADDGRVAILDQGAGHVVIVNDVGELIQDWAWRDHMEALPTDIAIAGETVFLADRAGARVVSVALDGSSATEFPVHDPPVALAAGPEGDIYIVGRSDWGLRYRSDGNLVARWRLPDEGVRAQDIAVGADGRVYVNYFSKWEVASAVYELLDAGVWVFEPGASLPGPDPDPAGCLAVPDKWAEPTLLPLGNETTVTLTVEGSCPGQPEEAQVIFILDTSRSMSWEQAGERAADAGLALLERLDPTHVEVGLVTFGDDGGLAVPLTRQHGAVSSAIAGADPWGDTQLGDGLVAARDEFAANGDPSLRQTVVILTDGALKDDPIPAAAALRGAGINIEILVFPTREFDAAGAEPLLAVLTGGLERVHMNPSDEEILTLADRYTGYVPEPGLFDWITIEDEIPANMEFVPGSASPTADLTGRVLTWRLPARAADRPIRLTYRLEPQEVGVWPTNVRADADYVDALSHPGELVFPVPTVRVWDPSSLPFQAFLPIGVSRGCVGAGPPADIILVIDASVSMQDPVATEGTKLDAAVGAAKAFVTFLDRRDQVGVVAFNAGAWTATPLTGDLAAVREGLDGIETSPGTLIDTGLTEASAVLASRREGSRPAVILLTDGRHNRDGAEVISAAEPLKASGALVFTIGLGGDVDRELLRVVASRPDDYHEAPDAGDLAAIYREIAARIPCATPGG